MHLSLVATTSSAPEVDNATVTYPPPLLPKPGKDNVRLQKLLKRTAKKKSSAQASQSATPFRSSLSPVNEASPDLERSDNSTPPKTPETPFSLHSIQPAPRFTARPLYQHVASPYPQRAAYPRPVSTSPQAVAAPSYTHMQDVTTFSSLSTGRGSTPTTQLSSFVADSQGKTPTSHTPSTGLKVETTVPTLEIKRATPTSDISRVTPTPDTKRATPTSDISRVTPTPDTKRATPTSDIKKAAPLSVINVKEPTYEFEISRITAGRPRTPARAADAASAATSASDKEVDKPLPAAEPLLKVLPKPKGIKTKASGWSRLKKHMVVEQEEPKFPEAEPEKEAGEQRKSEGKRQNEVAGEKAGAQDDRETSGSPKAVKMWDAVLFQMFSSKENIMHQIELNKSDTEKTEEKATEESKDIPSFAYRLPVLLFSPKFDAKKLKEAASRPVTKISTVFEMGLIGRKGKEEEPKDFNRTARGFAAS
uniref:Proline rich 33 n=1 Tax=Salarias fasciatus TaxID=181472 RepID=A0A672FUD4_SALFA